MMARVVMLAMHKDGCATPCTQVTARRPPCSGGRVDDARCYAVHASDGTPPAMLGFSSFSTAAWTLAPRDRFIGWTPELRERNLPLVVDDPRFLIPWIRIPNLGSHISRHSAPPAAHRLDGALQHHPGADRDLRRTPGLASLAALFRSGSLNGSKLSRCPNSPSERAP